MAALTYRTTVFRADNAKVLVVPDVPPEAVKIEPHDKDAFDAVTLRCATLAQRFVDAGIAAGIVTATDLAAGACA